MDFTVQIAEDRDSLIEDIKKMVSINSAKAEPAPDMPFGEGPARALECALKTAEQMGFETKNFDNYAGQIEFGAGDETVGILGHVDVVPCGDGWIIDPFQPEVIDGKLYGRGVLDNKGPVVVCLHALKILKEAKVPLRKKVRIILGANEETDWKCMDYYFNVKKAEPPEIAFTPDSEFPLKYAEKGMLQYKLEKSVRGSLRIGGGTVVNAVPEYAEVLLPAVKPADVQKAVGEAEEHTKCTYELTEKENGILLRTFGTAAHAMHPDWGINAIDGLMYVIWKMKTGDELGEIAEFYMNHLMHNEAKKNIHPDLHDEYSTPLSYNVGKMVCKDEKLTFYIDCRIPVSYPCEEVEEHIRKALQNTKFHMEVFDQIDPIYVEKDSFLVQTLLEVYKDVTGNEVEDIRADGSCTYARTMKNCISFGALLPGQPDLMHQKNEYLELDKLELWMKIYLEAIYRLAG